MISREIQPGILCKFQPLQEHTSTILLAEKGDHDRRKLITIYNESSWADIRNDAETPVMFLGFDPEDRPITEYRSFYILVDERVYYVVDDDWFRLVPWCC